MRLYLMRHGMAIDREDPDCPPEAERYLTPKGIERTRAAAHGLLELNIKPTVLLTSPYVRAVQTGEIVCEVLDLDPKRPARDRRAQVRGQALAACRGTGANLRPTRTHLLRARAAARRFHRLRGARARAVHRRSGRPASPAWRSASLSAAARFPALAC